jgi:Bacterial protein of unknown function (DUF903)
MRTTTTLLFLSAMLILTGCTGDYVITTNRGSQIGTKGKPHLKNGVYTYTDAAGKTGRIAAGSVAEIAPASMAEDESKSKFKPPSQ